MKKSVIAAVVVTALVVPSNSGAHNVSLTDPNDTQGKLDIKRMSVGHGSMILNLVFWNNVKKRYFHNVGFAGWIFDNRGRSQYDHSVFVEAHPRRNRPGTKLQCIVWDNRVPKILAKLKAVIDGARVRCRVPERIIDRMLRKVRGLSGHHDHIDDTDVLRH